MLVIVHQHDAVGILCQLREFAVIRAYALVDEEPQILRVELAIQLVDQGVVIRLRVVGQVFQVERDSAIAGIGGEERSLSWPSRFFRAAGSFSMAAKPAPMPASARHSS